MALLAPEAVFTPRSPEVNERMYVHRPGLEQAFEAGLRGALHLVLHGESGSGKSWLYKRMLRANDVPYLAANLANASRLGSIGKELQNLIDRLEKARAVGYSEGKAAEVSAVFAKGGLEHMKDYVFGQKEPYEAVLDFLSSAAKKKKAMLVLDNLEAAFGNAALLKELADIVILLDDERYGAYDVKLLVVGVPQGLHEYYASTPDRAPVATDSRSCPRSQD